MSGSAHTRSRPSLGAAKAPVATAAGFAGVDGDHLAAVHLRGRGEFFKRDFQHPADFLTPVDRLISALAAVRGVILRARGEGMDEAGKGQITGGEAGRGQHGHGADPGKLVEGMSEAGKGQTGRGGEAAKGQHGHGADPGKLAEGMSEAGSGCPSGG